MARIQSTGADIVKFATTAVDITDVARVFHITANSQVSDRKSCAIGYRNTFSLFKQNG